MAENSGTENHFCPNCGKEISPSDTFCPNCGYNLSEISATESATKKGRSSRSKRKKKQKKQGKVKKANPKKRKIILWSILGVVIVAGIIWGEVYYAKSATLDRITSDIKSGNGVQSDFISQDKKFKVTNSSLEPFMAYYQKHDSRLAGFKTQLTATGSAVGNHFTFKKTGRSWLLFPKYQIVIKPIYPTVMTNRNGAKIKLNNQLIATSDSTVYSKKIGPIVPGQYRMTASGTVSGHKLTNDGTYHISSDKSYNLLLKTISVSLNTEPKATVFLNGKELGTADGNGEYKLTDQPWEANMTVSAQYKTSAGTAKSKSVELVERDNNQDIKLNFTNLVGFSDADDLISNVFEAVSGLSGSGDDEDATDDDGTDLDDLFKDGSGNADYQELVKMATGYYGDDKIDSVTYDTDVESVEPAPGQKSLVTYTVKYTFDGQENDDDDEDEYTYEEHVQTFRYTATVVREDSSTYLVSSISQATKVGDYTKEMGD